MAKKKVCINFKGWSYNERDAVADLIVAKGYWDYKGKQIDFSKVPAKKSIALIDKVMNQKKACF